MIFMNLYKISAITFKYFTANSRLLLFCLLSMLSPMASSVMLVTQVEGQIMVKLPGNTPLAQLYPGALLPDQVITSTRIADSRYWVLCPGSDKPQFFKPQDRHQQHCPTRQSRNMRGISKKDTPFILLPNQYALGELERVIWSGSAEDQYSISLYKYEADGTENLVIEWEPENSTYQSSGFHEFILKTPLALEFTEKEEVTFQLVVENINTQKSSDEFDEILIKPITQKPSSTQLKKAYRLLRDQKIQRESELGKLVLATYLTDKGQRAEAYVLLSDLHDSRYRTQAELLKAPTLYQPGTPEDIIIKQYGKALEFAVADSDDLSSVIACRGILSPSPLLLTNEGLIYQKQMISKPEHVRFCPKP